METTKILPICKLQVKPLSIGEISRIYGVGRKTLYRWIKPFTEEIGERRGRFYNILQVRLIFVRLGVPELMKAA